MDEFIKLLDINLNYGYHEIVDDICHITVFSNREKVECPYCGQMSMKVHSTYERTFQDLPMQGKKVIVKIHNRKMFCLNPDCTKITFAERFDFLFNKSKKTTRLEEKLFGCH